jgi:2-amino-4-hydroxy-6-hydroxymethyldihydropteridine diphosphokinase
MSHAWIGLGSNLGDRAALLERAVELLADAGVRPLRCSHLYETAPEGGADEPDYLNAVLQAETDRGPRELLGVLAAVEEQLGRPPAPRTGPRPVDLDLLALGEWIVADQDLTLPHPRLAARAFVLVPLCELDPAWTDPRTGEAAGDLLAALDVQPDSVRPFGTLGGRRAPACEYPWKHLSGGIPGR